MPTIHIQYLDLRSLNGKSIVARVSGHIKNHRDLEMIKLTTMNFRALFLGVLVAGMLVTSCKDSPVSSADEAELNATSLTTGGTAGDEVELVFKSDETVTTWDPILPESADPNWPTTVCNESGSIGLNAAWVNPHTAYNIRSFFSGGLHPFEVWFPHHDFDAVWINAYNHDQSSVSGGPNGYNWSKYEMPVSGDGDFVVQLLADNCSWIYLDGTLVGYQDESGLEDPTSGKYGVTLDGDHTLSFIIFDGGGAAGGKFRLETTESYGGTLPPLEPQNTAPEADAGDDQTLEATGSTTAVNLDGAGTDADDDELSYSWTYEGSEISTTASAQINLPLGSHTLTLTVSDGTASDSDEVTVIIGDTTAPEVTYTQVTGNLWPPNHKMVLVATDISATDLVDGATAADVSVTSNESSNGRGDGNTEEDYEIVTNADGSVDVYLRAERSGKGGGRTYTVTVTATDSEGNSGGVSFTASVAKSRGK